tara:strand:+ start:262 stop:978 length:717 start_codon:yes stop_codon:yes gene_type:complete
MKYMGSKARIAKHILPIILKDRVNGQWYVEPFVGGGNIIQDVNGSRIGSDFNCAAVKALKYIRDQKTPTSNKEYSENDYKLAAEIARTGNYVTELNSYALIAFSFGAKWIGGWSRGKSKNGKQRDYVAEQHKASEKQKPKLQGLSLVSCSYNYLNIPKNSVVYCDPPYRGVTGYKDKFNHDDFWQWCRNKTNEGHQVFISEYNAPNDFKCIWQQALNVSVARSGKQKTAIEKLFIYNG